MVVNTDLTKQLETDHTYSYALQCLTGRYMISGVGSIPLSMIDSYPPSVPSAMEWCHLLGQVRFVLPCLRSFYFYCWIRIPYPTKQVRAGLHELFSKAALGSAAYQPLSTFVLVSEQRQILLWDLCSNLYGCKSCSCIE
jgi:hypothetical protein